MDQQKEQSGAQLSNFNFAELTRDEANQIYDQGREAVIKVLCAFSRQIVILQKQVSTLQEEVNRLQEEVNRLQEEVNRLKEQIAKDSHNSSKPPSSDGLKKPATHSLRQKSEREPGGQEGHKGHTLKMVNVPEQIVQHTIDQCGNCGYQLEQEQPIDIEKRQVFDIPAIKMVVTEHQAQIKKCPKCHQISKAQFPAEVKAPAQYGQRLKATAVYLKGYQLLPYQRSAELLRDIFSCEISQGSLAEITSSCSNLLSQPVEQIKQQIMSSDVVNFDESGARVQGQRQWLHAASTQKLTYYEIHPKRGSEAMDQIGILKQYNGRAIHDFWKPYFKYECNHGLCNAHHLRELTFIYEEQGQEWAKKMIECLVDIKKAVESTRNNATSLSKEKIAEFEKRYQEILQEGYDQNPLIKESPERKTRGAPKKSKARNLLQRLDTHRKEVLAFMYDFNVPFDNNLSERDIRMVKVQQKISGTFRSKEGARAFCRIRSYISTARKNAVNVIEAIHNVLAGTPFIPMVGSP